MIESRATPQFWRLLRDLPIHVQQDARRAFLLFKENPLHPSLRFKKLEAHDPPCYSVRVNARYRALCIADRNRLVWFWIGIHAGYDRLV